MDSFVNIEDRCEITCDVTGDEVQLRFGGSYACGLEMVVTEDALEKIVKVGAAALERLRAKPENEAGAEREVISA
ncbi:hypothetical protein [Amycolatopsis samaneae]|uniref:DUF2997 domain-containing protein n=1 Tax=Amycolatopsis samaneae TaxID=664691 RepID=A0ABW5GG96_9PSEU